MAHLQAHQRCIRQHCPVHPTPCRLPLAPVIIRGASFLLIGSCTFPAGPLLILGGSLHGTLCSCENDSTSTAQTWQMCHQDMPEDLSWA
jgi:hypothetical protein